MKIIDIQRFINRFKVLTEAVTLPNIRQGILGKKGKKEYPVIDSDKEWYEEHKDEVLKTIEKALNVNDKTLKIKLQKFDTDDFFTNDKPRKLKVKELLISVRRNFISQVERSRNTEDKTIGIEAQYEMMKMGNGVEVYAVYTPMANRYLTHTKLHIKGCFSPTWCIASSDANNMWNCYHLYEADYPSVFIVAQKTENGYNPVKYELKCNPYKSSKFNNKKITLRNWVDEWREPQQDECSYKDSSLFKTFNISLKELEETIRKLVKTKKAEQFSGNFGKDMLKLYTEKINSKDEDAKMEYLTKACKNGTFINFCNKIDRDDKDYFLDELIRYGTLTEMEVQSMKMGDNEKALSYLIKNKRCTFISLKWANQYHNENTLKRVYHSIPEDILLADEIDDVDVRREILENIKNVKELKNSFLKTLIKNGKVKKYYVNYIKDDKELRTLYVHHLIKIDDIHSDILPLVKDDKDLFVTCAKILIDKEKKCGYILKYANDSETLTTLIQYIIKNDKVNNDVLLYVNHDKKLLISCVQNMLKNGKDEEIKYHIGDDKDLLNLYIHHLIKRERINDDVLRYAHGDKKLMSVCIQILIKNNKVDYRVLEYVKDDKELLTSCVQNLIKNDKIDATYLHYLKNDMKLLTSCVQYMIENDKTDGNILNYINHDDEIFSLCVQNLIKNNKVNAQVLYHVKDNKKLLSLCIKNIIENGNNFGEVLRGLRQDEKLMKLFNRYVIENNKVDNDYLYYANFDKRIFSSCVQNMIENDKVDDETLERVEDNKKLLSLCIQNLINNDKVDDNVLDYASHSKKLLTLCIQNLIKNDRVYSGILTFVSRDKELLGACLQNMIKNDAVDWETLHRIYHDEELSTLCIQYLVKNNKVDDDVLDIIKSKKKLREIYNQIIQK